LQQTLELVEPLQNLLVSIRGLILHTGILVWVDVDALGVVVPTKPTHGLDGVAFGFAQPAELACSHRPFPPCKRGAGKFGSLCWALLDLGVVGVGVWFAVVNWKCSTFVTPHFFFLFFFFTKKINK